MLRIRQLISAILLKY